uniref:NADH dehydrogenase [ubiquinone] 1 alpha subcomplex subunit 12 n=1 Tax=Strigamia maritima TaxID=126957 RepID=T1J3E4_STRMM
MSRKPPQPRGVWATVWKNFFKSLGIARGPSGTVVGKDQFGTKYWEIPSVDNKRASRWFEAVEKDKFDQEIPVEWEAWLRGRRKVPPTEDEIRKNNAIQQNAIRKAKELEEQDAAKRPMNIEPKREPEKKSFPEYKDYEER